MSVAVQQRPMTVEAFLAWEERQPVRYEFDGVHAVAIAGGSLAHSAIAVNLAVTIGGALRGKPGRLYNGDAKVLVAGNVRYPDLSVSCSEQTMPDLARQGMVPEPVAVFEVLSESTAVVDRTDKNAGYQATPSIRRYVMLEQDRIAATVFTREAGDWVGHLLIGADALLALPDIGIEAVRLGGFYEGVSLATPTDDDAAP